MKDWVEMGGTGETEGGFMVDMEGWETRDDPAVVLRPTVYLMFMFWRQS